MGSVYIQCNVCEDHTLRASCDECGSTDVSHHRLGESKGAAIERQLLHIECDQEISRLRAQLSEALGLLRQSWKILETCALDAIEREAFQSITDFLAKHPPDSTPVLPGERPWRCEERDSLSRESTSVVTAGTDCRSGTTATGVVQEKKCQGCNGTGLCGFGRPGFGACPDCCGTGLKRGGGG